MVLSKEQKIVADDKKKFPMTRRTFLGGMGAGIASLMIPFGKTSKVATTAAKVMPEMAAKGMPDWFPLLVNRIMNEGKQVQTATGGRNPTNVYEFDNGKDVYRLYEDAVSGHIEVSARGDNFQQVSFEYIPATEMRRPDGKAFTQDGEFYAGEFQKGEYQDFENYSLDGVNELKIPINSIEDFATGGKLTKEQAEEEVANFLRDTTKIDYDGFAQGGRVGYQDGNLVQPMTREEYEKRVRMQAKYHQINELVKLMESKKHQGYSIPIRKEGLSSQGYYNSMDDVFFGGVNYNDGNKNLNIGTVIPSEGQPSYNTEFSYAFANGGPVIRPQGMFPPERGPMHNGIQNLFKQRTI